MALSLAFQLSEWENAWTVIKYKNRIKWIENRWRDLCVTTALALFYFIYFLINVTVKTSTVGQGEVTEGDISSQPCLVVSMRSCCPDSCCLDNSDEECVDCNFFFIISIYVKPLFPFMVSLILTYVIGWNDYFFFWSWTTAFLLIFLMRLKQHDRVLCTIFTTSLVF